MFALLLSAALICLGSLALGQGVMALCGAREWNWLAVPVGIATMMLLAVPALHVPGRSMTVAVVIALLIVAGLVLWVLRPPHRPPLSDVLAGLPVALLVLIPFLATGRAGTLGVSNDNDMAAHMLLVEAYKSKIVTQVTASLTRLGLPSYPLGPHALVTAVAECLGVRVDLAFAGLTAALPILLAWTALACLRRVPWIGRLVAITVTGIPFLVAGYYGEGSFKELLEAQFVLAVALMLGGFQPALGRRRWIPLALVLAGAVSVYSAQGLLWPILFIGAWLVGRTATRVWSSGLRAAGRDLSAELVPGVLGLGVMIIVLVPQIPRVHRFISASANNGIAKTNIGNLLGPLPGWEAFGVWNNPDFRLPPTDAFTAGMWTAFVLVLVIFGVLWSLRRKHWMLPSAAALTMLVWAYSNHTQSPYVAAKALMIASPLLLLLAALPLVQRRVMLPGWWRFAAPMLAVVLLVRVVDSSVEALRSSTVGPTAHLVELRSLRPLLGTQPTLFLGDDDFIEWELAGARVTPAYLGEARVPLQPEKSFVYGQPLDFDSVDAQTLNEFDWVITTRDAAGSEPPPQMHLVRTTRDYELWKRVGEVQPREILDEGSNAAAVLDCHTAAGRTLARGGGVAAVRSPSVEAPAPALAPGGHGTVVLQLGAGRWDLETPYVSPLPLQVSVSASGLRTTLPANLDRPGPRWPIGQISLSHAGPITVTFHSIGSNWLTPESDVAVPSSVIATPVNSERIVPLRHICGKLVDWYKNS
jgi:hypothetical protein